MCARADDDSDFDSMSMVRLTGEMDHRGTIVRLCVRAVAFGCAVDAHSAARARPAATTAYSIDDEGGDSAGSG